MKRIIQPPRQKQTKYARKIPHVSTKTALELPPLNTKIPKSARTPVFGAPADTPSVSGTMFEGPVKPAFIFLNFSYLLTSKENHEILQYKQIWYIRKGPPVSKSSSGSTPNYFPFIANDHIAFRYQQIEVLGKGSFGSVIRCFDHKTKQDVAIKMLRDQPKVHSQLIFEVNIMEQLQKGDYIIHLIDNFMFRGFFCIVMELMGSDIYTSLKKQRFLGFETTVVQMVAREASRALSYIHSLNIVHADIKPENILFTDPTHSSIRVIDFGCAFYTGHIQFSYLQSRYYRAPEVVFGYEFGKEIDIWSLACVICEMITGQPLFSAEDEIELIQMISVMIGPPPYDIYGKCSRARYYFDERGKFKIVANSAGKVYVPGSSSIKRSTRIGNPSLIALLDACFKWNPKDRITAAQFMNFDWVKAIHEPAVMPQSARI